MPSVPTPTRTPASSMSRVRQIPEDRRRLEPGLLATTAPESATIAMSSSVGHTKWARLTSGPRMPRSASRRTAVVPWCAMLKAISERVSRQCVVRPGAELVGQRAAPQVELVRDGRRPVGRGQDAHAPAAPVPVGHQAAVGRLDLVNRPRVAHVRGAHLRGDVRRQPGQERVVALVGVAVAVAEREAEPDARAQVPVGLQGDVGREVGQAAAAVVGVHHAGLPAADGVHQADHQHVVEVVLADLAEQAVHPEVGELEDRVVDALDQVALAVVMGVDEARAPPRGPGEPITRA